MLAGAQQRVSKGDLRYAVAVVAAYVMAAWLATQTFHLSADRMMILADRIARGHLDAPQFEGTVDSVLRDGRYYIAVGPLQVAPYLLFVPFTGLQRFAPYVVSLVMGIVAAWCALPLVRAYGATGLVAYWIAAFAAFGTLLFYVSVFGDFYYLAHAESSLVLALLLIEWAGRRRPLVLGVLLALSFLARPPTVLAAIPLVVVLVSRPGSRLRAALAFAAPVGLAVLAMAAFNWARFGSPTETGYAVSLISEPTLIQRRALGVFSIAQIPENIRLALLAGFRARPTFPYLIPDRHGLSMLLVSPGLAMAAYAGIRTRPAQVLWAAAALVALPIFMYYGGGYVQYGFRYSLDFTPFLIALVAMGSRRRFGGVERLLILASIGSVAYGVLWHAHPFP